MRSSWKVKNFISSSGKLVNGAIHLFKRRGFLNPFLEGYRINIYTGGRFRNYKIRREMVDQPLHSFIITRPPFSSIKKKFLALKKKR